MFPPYSVIRKLLVNLNILQVRFSISCLTNLCFLLFVDVLQVPCERGDNAFPHPKGLWCSEVSRVFLEILVRIAWASFHSSVTFLGFAVMLASCVNEYCKSKNMCSGIIIF